MSFACKQPTFFRGVLFGRFLQTSWHPFRGFWEFRSFRGAWLIGLVCLLGAFTGCQSANQFQGQVVVGPQSFAGIVASDDPRLLNEGLARASVSVVLDPDRLNAIRKQPVQTDPNGHFTVPMPEAFGGFQSYDLQVIVERVGYEPAVYRGPLPFPSKTFLVVLGQGHGPRVPSRQGDGQQPDEPSLDQIIQDAEKLQDAYN